MDLNNAAHRHSHACILLDSEEEVTVSDRSRERLSSAQPADTRLFHSKYFPFSSTNEEFSYKLFIVARDGGDLLRALGWAGKKKGKIA